MQTLLWILGIGAAVFVAIVLGIIFVWYFVKWKLRRWVNKLGEGVSGLMNAVPARITLVENEAERPEKHAKEYERWNKAMAEAGLARVAQFAAKEQPDLVLTGYADESRSIYACVAVLPQPGVTVDIFSRLQNGHSFTHTTLAETGMDRPEFAPMVRMPEASARELIDAHLRDRQGKAARPVAVAGFKREYQHEYARQMDWRMLRGVRPEEIQRVHAKMKGAKEMTPEELKTVVRTTNMQYAYMLDGLLTQQFRKSRTMASGEWDRIVNRVVVVHDRSDPMQLSQVLGPAVLSAADQAAAEEAVADAYAKASACAKLGDDDDNESDGSGYDPEDADTYRSLTAEIEAKPRREAFREIAARAIPPHAFTHLGVVEGLLTADVWLRPEFERAYEDEDVEESDGKPDGDAGDD